MNINIKIIPHSEQRYETVGDWWFEYKETNLKPYTADSEINPLAPSSLEIRVSDLGKGNVSNFYESLCIAVHELIEVILCSRRGITQEVVDKFDIEFEAKRLQNLKGYAGEAGDSSEAPYRKEHFFATSIERLLCAELGIDWKEYEDKINSL